MKSRFKMQKREQQKREIGPLRSQLSEHPQENFQSIKTLSKAPFLNPNPLTHWSGPKNICWVRINDESCWALLDNGSTINAVTPEFIETHFLDVGPLNDLFDGRMGINGFGGLFSKLWGYITLRAQVEGVPGYDEGLVALVIPDSTAFGSQVPVTLGMLTINWIINVIKERKIDELSASLSGLRISHLLACH